MSERDFHVMNLELIEVRQTMRYTCPKCGRCLEDGPEGIKVINRGDQNASHRGGSLVPAHYEIEQERPPTPILH